MSSDLVSILGKLKISISRRFCFVVIFQVNALEMIKQKIRKIMWQSSSLMHFLKIAAGVWVRRPGRFMD